jgi:hypothetical protein
MSGELRVDRNVGIFLLFSVCLLACPWTQAQSRFIDGVESDDMALQVLRWQNGTIVDAGTNWACLADPPILETRVLGYAGYSLLPPNFTPAVGEVFYTHLVLSHPGNPCTGSAVYLELMLPNGVVPATSINDPAFCFMVASNGNRLFDLGADNGYGCPQSFPQGLEGLAVLAPRGGAGSGLWGMARGYWLEFLIPLRATQPQNFSNLRWRVNPDVGVVAYPSVPLQVNNEVIFRNAMEDQLLTLDVCTITPPTVGC